jgi:methylenetetrahydrofolate dehydrogenase (NADP+)/methenyltetrahydrofolate cyclohydrolase
VTAIVIDGNVVRDTILAEIRATIDAAGNPPVCLATVLVGDDKPSQSYIRSKQKKAGEAGIQSRHTDLPATASQAQVNDTIAALAADPGVHGILCQFPLPDGLDMEQVLDQIPFEKDVDGLTERSMGRLVRGQSGHVGCTPLGVMRLLERYHVPTVGKRAVVVGRSTLTGLPQVLLLGRKGCDATVTLAHSRTPAADMIEIVPRPGRTAVVNYPLQVTSEIELRARLRRDGADRPLAAVEIRLIPVNSGEIIGVRTDHAGVAFVEGVRPGRYLVTLDPEQAQDLGMSLDGTLELVVPGTGGFVRGGDLYIHIRSPESGS